MQSSFSTKTEPALLSSKVGRGTQFAKGHASSPSDSPLSLSFNFSLELVKSSQFVASFYEHMVVQRRVKNLLEENSVVGITNYIDFGFELQTSVDDAIAANSISDSTFQIGASWQANKDFLLKAKVGPKSSTLDVAFKS
ncbi:hypothetical protein KIW84_031588 [Lathyrus oleraceus]|uniref:Uncharacterized protein n=1 Tax=Pisum sativum TaxID=3888 RepID=A0A9D4XW76_PEA|nr:hypothetical protein KIW84_031588 [Pisum sativum]